MRSSLAALRASRGACLGGGLAVLAVLGGGASAMAAAAGGAPHATAAQAAGQVSGRTATAAATHYTHSTTLAKAQCPVYLNYPKGGVAPRHWTKHRTAAGKRTHLGVRYTYKGYALVLDYAKKKDPSWGFIAKSCLTDPYAYSQGDRGTRLGDLRAIGGNGQVKAVPISAAHRGKKQRTLIRVGSNGTLRSAPKSFVIGNGVRGDAFRITTKHCGHHSSAAWILGYAPASGRWGYIQAAHLPACR
ncbi:hypothetical protein [Actinomadura fibrosa]|uniref:SH3 domain-containing protein n=1 Tax=Actinomadura fibrosa TaxID=111802 RepID=A0ABW2XIL9_9ACTN|nr:hypothetical protein [Actinomadura fibrosa]